MGRIERVREREEKNMYKMDGENDNEEESE